MITFAIAGSILREPEAARIGHLASNRRAFLCRRRNAARERAGARGLSWGAFAQATRAIAAAQAPRAIAAGALPENSLASIPPAHVAPGFGGRAAGGPGCWAFA